MKYQTLWSDFYDSAVFTRAKSIDTEERWRKNVQHLSALVAQWRTTHASNIPSRAPFLFLYAFCHSLWLWFAVTISRFLSRHTSTIEYIHFFFITLFFFYFSLFHSVFLFLSTCCQSIDNKPRLCKTKWINGKIENWKKDKKAFTRQRVVGVFVKKRICAHRTTRFASL